MKRNRKNGYEVERRKEKRVRQKRGVMRENIRKERWRKEGRVGWRERRNEGNGMGGDGRRIQEGKRWEERGNNNVKE